MTFWGSLCYPCLDEAKDCCCYDDLEDFSTHASMRLLPLAL
jgi:hypothetical protein